MERQCQLAEVSRAGFYRYLQQSTPAQADLLLRARLQELALAHHRLSWLPDVDCVAAAWRRAGSQSQARTTYDARRQPAELATDEVCVYDRFAA